MTEKLTLNDAEEIRINTVYSLAKSAYKSRKKGDKAIDFLGEIALKFGYKSYRNVYNIVLKKKENDAEFQKWWKENKLKQPKTKA